MFTFNLTKDLEKSMDYLEEQREEAIKENPKILKYANSNKRGIPMWTNIPVALFSIFCFAYMYTEQIIYIYIAFANMFIFF